MSGVTRRVLAFAGAAAALGAVLAVPKTHARTIGDVVRAVGPAARERLRPSFAEAGIAYPPHAVTLLALKEERRLELWAGGRSGPQKRVKTYPILAASGVAGPKLRQGDRQVPEGAYRILWLNPASGYHLSLKVDYPNAFDRRHARAEGRANLGGDIFIHGRDVSIGCIALGDPAIEEVFVLAHDVGVPRLKVLIAPHDLRRRSAEPQRAPWMDELYRTLRAEMTALGAS